MADQWGRNRIKAVAIRAKVDPKLAEPVIEGASLSQELKDLFGELAPHALAEHGLDPSVSPTGCMLGIAGMWGIGLWQACASLEAAGKATEKPKEAASAT